MRILGSILRDDENQPVRVGTVALLSFDAQGNVSMSEEGPLQGEIDISKNDFAAIIDAGINHLVDRR
ncbi:hypothetical protein AB9F39_37700, partial [Rhizobium leguminosarum]|uniref:hypothetical protein n=1 Tax=Rhizobium leguminosarum TaxID=384 RepID=UPI003F9E5858